MNNPLAPFIKGEFGLDIRQEIRSSMVRDSILAGAAEDNLYRGFKSTQCPRDKQGLDDLVLEPRRRAPVVLQGDHALSDPGSLYSPTSLDLRIHCRMPQDPICSNAHSLDGRSLT
jgi:hypothetical protein